MVGTFYRAPSPQDPPFVEVGDRVEAGDPVCMIEVMKLFTTIEAQQAGRIVEIAVENATAVEYDQALFVIEPA
jgi:acetyl-CoA carboxylase biotin carboxyl carrier protein